jgi:hypothetical protein
MKRFFLFFAAFLFFLSSFGQDSTDSVKGPIITWETISYDFGEIKQGERVERTFKFSNTGTAPLVITNVEVTCGCTTPRGWPRDPIMPGGKGELTVAFNSVGKYGRQNKVIKVISNSVGDKNQVMFTANVLVNK